MKKACLFRISPPQPKIDKFRKEVVDFYFFTLHFSLFTKFYKSIFGSNM